MAFYWCKTQPNFCKQIQSTSKIIRDQCKQVDGPTKFFLIGKSSFPIFLNAYFFPANFFKHIKSSPEKNQAYKFSFPNFLYRCIFYPNFFKQLNLFSRFFHIGEFSSRIFLNRYRFPAKNLPLVQSCREKNRVGEKHS